MINRTELLCFAESIYLSNNYIILLTAARTGWSLIHVAVGHTPRHAVVMFSGESE